MANQLDGKNPTERLMNLVSAQPGTSLDILADALRSALKLVILTQAAYDALPVKDANTIYITVN